jgi:hypothetical protein
MAFALWGFIPPEGGEQYKSSIVDTVVVDELNGTSSKKSNSRRAVKKAEAQLKDYERDLERRGTTTAKRGSSTTLESKQDDDIAKLMDVMVSGRKELNNQRLFQLRKRKCEGIINYNDKIIKELKDEIKDAKDEGASQEELQKLKDDLVKAKKDRADAYQNWMVLNSAEEERRITIDITNDIEIDDCVSSVTTSTPSLSLKRKIDVTTNISVDEASNIREEINSEENKEGENVLTDG